MDTAPSVAYCCAYGELRIVRGVMTLRNDALHLEYETADGLLGVFKSILIKKQIPLAEIDTFEYCTWHFGWSPKVKIRTRSMESLTTIAGAKQNKLIVSVDKADRRQAQALVQFVRLKLSEHVLQNVESQALQQPLTNSK